MGRQLTVKHIILWQDNRAKDCGDKIEKVRYC